MYPKTLFFIVKTVIMMIKLITKTRLKLGKLEKVVNTSFLVLADVINISCLIVLSFLAAQPINKTQLSN